MKQRNTFRTDLALEAADTGDGKLPEGVFTQEEQRSGVSKTVVEIQTEQAAQRLGRPIGRYITLEAPFAVGEPLVSWLAEELSTMLPEGPCLVVGLGNRSITPDTLGPDVVHSIIATRHIPQNQREAIGLGGLRDVCAIAPGAMGQTGIEACQIAAMVTASLPFCSVVAVDALAARSMNRLGNTVQLSNTGIAPGSGVQNRRSSLTEESLGVPVLALGIPTVVDAGTIIGDLAPQSDIPKEAQGLIVTPRDIDTIIAHGVKIVATALNRALQPQLSAEDVDALMS